MGTQTAKAFPYGAGNTSAISWTATSTDGQLVIGSTAGNPQVANLTAGLGIDIVNASNSITINATGGGIEWTDVTGTTQTITAHNAYLSNNAGTVTFTLPATSTIGDVFQIVGVQGAWTIAQNANQQLFIGSSSTTSGIGGSMSSTNAGDCVQFVALNTSASSLWRCFDVIGNITVV